MFWRTTEHHPWCLLKKTRTMQQKKTTTRTEQNCHKGQSHNALFIGLPVLKQWLRRSSKANRQGRGERRGSERRMERIWERGNREGGGGRRGNSVTPTASGPALEREREAAQDSAGEKLRRGVKKICGELNAFLLTAHFAKKTLWRRHHNTASVT